ncbi:MAG TPA: redox-regulated ATPase YchF [Proteobacteria bacterium]|nr:redox-regulated ATPase YchF [Pseudomonadota bacterium]
MPKNAGIRSSRKDSIMKIGLAGYSGSGVTSVLALFSQDLGLLGRHGSPEIRSIKLHDPRLQRLTELFNPRKVTPVQLDIVELGDLRPERGGGLRKETVGRAAGLDALAVVLRGFEAPMSPRIRSPEELMKEMSSLFDEFTLTDMMPVEGRLERLEKEGKGSSREASLLKRIRARLEDGESVRSMGLTPDEDRSIAGYQFLTRTPLYVLVNVGEDGAGKVQYPELEATCVSDGIGYMEICGKAELELLEIPEEERAVFQEELGLGLSSKDRFITGAFELIDLITFFTVGEDEVRGWTVPNGIKAAEAAGKIHSDLQRGFIRAEVLPWDDCLALGGLAAAKETGRLRIEGKEYILKDGEIFHVRFNV